jgi:alkanesulfonate monooxygenase SsuD/methylene tetrahydromethanopterin reductase-like flavin-dependent oxidoreductase (luciferase family)
MKVGVFDHLDRSGAPLGQQYQDRLRLIAAYEDCGVHAYHLAEHHATPLGMAPSPNLFLSAVAQRTRRMRFGPLVYPLVLYHPLRLIEEICMLDHLSAGRLEFGIGRGASPHELEIYGADPANWAPKAHLEALEVLMQGLTREVIDFEGEIFQFRNTPVELRPLQRPHPPMWYGASRAEGAADAARRGFNIVVNAPAERARPIYQSYRQAWSESGKREADLPLMGMNRFVVIADSDAAAAKIAARAYQLWNGSFWKLWDDRGPRPYTYYPDTFAEAEAQGFGVAGSARKVLDVLSDQLRVCGANYLVCRFAFGDMLVSEAMNSLEQFAEQVLPHLGAGETVSD